MEPITREEVFMKAAGEQKAVNLPTPITREERYLAKSAGLNVTIPEPITRKEMYLYSIANSGGGSGGADSAVTELLEGTTTEIINHTVKKLHISAFFDFTELTTAHLSAVETIGTSAFASCKKLKSVSLPNATVIEPGAFDSCDTLTSVDIPNVIKIFDSAFYGCTELERIDLPKAIVIFTQAFMDCRELKIVILRSTKQVCNIELSAFDATPMLTGQGHIYVPTVMYESYRAGYEAALDQLMPGFFNILFRKIEDYPEICG